MDLNPEDIARALSAEPGPQAKHPLWDAYWKEVGRYAPFLGMAIPSPSGVGAMSAAARPIAGSLTPAANPNPMNLDAVTQMLRAVSGKTPPANINRPGPMGVD